MDSFLIILGIMIFIVIALYLALDMKDLNKKISSIRSELFDTSTALHDRSAKLENQIKKIETLIPLLMQKNPAKKKGPPKKPRR